MPRNLKTSDPRDTGELQDNTNAFMFPLISFQRMMEDTLQNFNKLSWSSGLHDKWMPRIKVWEDDRNFYLKTRLPSDSPDNVNVSVHDDYMTIEWSAEDESTERTEGGLMQSLYSSHRAYRTVMIPPNADTDGAEAWLEGGVLEVTVPKTEARERGRTIPVNSTMSQVQGQNGKEQARKKQGQGQRQNQGQGQNQKQQQ